MDNNILDNDLQRKNEKKIGCGIIFSLAEGRERRDMMCINYISIINGIYHIVLEFMCFWANEVSSWKFCVCFCFNGWAQQNIHNVTKSVLYVYYPFSGSELWKHSHSDCKQQR